MQRDQGVPYLLHFINCPSMRGIISVRWWRWCSLFLTDHPGTSARYLVQKGKPDLEGVEDIAYGVEAALLNYRFIYAYPRDKVMHHYGPFYNACVPMLLGMEESNMNTHPLIHKLKAGTCFYLASSSRFSRVSLRLDTSCMRKCVILDMKS